MTAAAAGLRRSAAARCAPAMRDRMNMQCEDTPWIVRGTRDLL
jgi:hypothetical protein